MIEFQNILMQLRHAGIRAGLEAVSLIPAGVRSGSVAGRGVIFTLHHVRPAQTHAFQPNAHLSITPEFLDAALRVTMEQGLLPARLEDVPSLLGPQEKGRFFAVSLDDGYRNNAEFAAPIFRKYGVPYTIFVSTGFAQGSRTPWWEVAEQMLLQSDRIRIDCGHGSETISVSTLEGKGALFRRIAAFVNNYDEDAAVARIEAAAREAGVDPYGLLRELIMDVHELRDLAQSDPLVSFGAHTVSHCNLKRVEANRLRAEIRESVEGVEAITGRRPSTFAYPYGWVSAAGVREARALEEAGLLLGVTTQPGVLRSNTPGGNYLLPRISLNGLYQQPRFVRALISGIPFLFRR